MLPWREIAHVLLHRYRQRSVMVALMMVRLFMAMMARPAMDDPADGAMMAMMMWPLMMAMALALDILNSKVAALELQVASSQMATGAP